MLRHHKAKVSVNTHELENAVKRLKVIRDALAHEQHNIKKMQHLYDAAISGTAPGIKKFDHQFDAWLNQLEKVIAEADILYHILNHTLHEAREKDLAGVLKALASISYYHFD